MAYGMRSSELAAVGRNVNEQGRGVSEDSIQTGLEQELTADRKEVVQRNKARASDAKAKDAIQKAELKSQMVKAVVDSAIQVGGAAAQSASTPKGQAASAAKAETRMTSKADRLGARTQKFQAKLPEGGGTDRQLDKLGRLQTKTKGAQTKAIQQGVKAQRLKDQYEIGEMYKKSGRLYGTNRNYNPTTDKELDSKLFGGSE